MPGKIHWASGRRAPALPSSRHSSRAHRTGSAPAKPGHHGRSGTRRPVLGFVGGEHDARAGRQRVEETELGLSALIGEEALAGSEHQWVDREDVSVDEVVRYQRPDKV